MVWDVDPEIVRVGNLAIRWYSLSFIIGSIIGYRYVASILTGENFKNIQDYCSSMLTYLFLGTLLGARLGHCLFYEPEIYLKNPLKILMVWEGGLASHGGLMGIALAIFLFVKNYGQSSFFGLLDVIAAPSMLTSALIRIGNFFNSEILGLPSDVPWAVIFKKIDMQPRHPAMLYESFMYFVVSAIGFMAFKKFRKKWVDGSFFGLVLMLGMSARFMVEFFKENQLALENRMPINIGQILSVPFIFIGLYLFLGRQKK